MKQAGTNYGVIIACFSQQLWSNTCFHLFYFVMHRYSLTLINVQWDNFCNDSNPFVWITLQTSWVRSSKKHSPLPQQNEQTHFMSYKRARVTSHSESYPRLSHIRDWLRSEPESYPNLTECHLRLTQICCDQISRFHKMSHTQAWGGKQSRT